MNILPKSPTFSPVPLDDDELIQEIEHQAEINDDQWDLTEQADSEQLSRYWESVEGQSLQEEQKKI